MKVIAIQGIAGSYHHIAAKKFFKDEEIYLLECKNFKSVCKSTAGSDADFGVISIENSISGTMLPNYGFIEKYGLHVVGEVLLNVNMHLLGLKQDGIGSIHTVQSHPVALLFCENFLDEHPDWLCVEKFDTASSAKEIAEKEMRGVATIGSEELAKLYNLKIIEENIQNEKVAFMRFFVLNRKKIEIPDFNKVSMKFTLEHRFGRIAVFLNQLIKNKITLTKIQSVPSNSEYVEFSYYVDILIENHESYNEFLDSLKRITTDLKIFGEYKQFVG